MGNGGVKSKDVDKQGVLLKDSRNPEFSATSRTYCFCAFTRSITHSLAHSLSIHLRQPRCSTDLQGNQNVDLVCLKRQRSASALNAGIKCIPPCLTSPGITNSSIRGQLWLDHNSPHSHGALTLKLSITGSPVSFPSCSSRKAHWSQSPSQLPGAGVGPKP